MDWVQLFSQNRVHYITKGPNVSHGCIAVKCPFCGNADPSQHLNISLRGNRWWCWRNRQHRGRYPARLIQALLNCSYEYARQLSGDPTEIADDFLSKARRMMNPPITVQEKRRLQMPKDFLTFRDLPSARPFYSYLISRGFAKRQIPEFSRMFDLRYCTSGSFKGRIIFPIVYRKELVGWTGRTIYAVEKLRYKALTPDPDKARREGLAPALGINTNYLLWYDHVVHSGSDSIFLCEGPFDALRLWMFGYTATCFFTSAPSEPQILHLHKILPLFKNKYLLLDNGTLGTGVRLTGSLSALGVRLLQLPPGVKDPGVMVDKRQLEKLLDYRKESL